MEALLAQPNEPHRILIGYARGLIVLWDRASKVAVQTYVASQQLESLAWRNDGSQFVSSHNDGSYVIWSTQGNVEPLDEGQQVHERQELIYLPTASSFMAVWAAALL